MGVEVVVKMGVKVMIEVHLLMSTLLSIMQMEKRDVDLVEAASAMLVNEIQGNPGDLYVGHQMAETYNHTSRQNQLYVES